MTLALNSFEMSHLTIIEILFFFLPRRIGLNISWRHRHLILKISC